MKMCGDGARGGLRGCMLAWWGRWSPLRRLHGAQQATMLSHSALPPFERGMTWSTVRFEREPQYWQGPLWGGENARGGVFPGGGGGGALGRGGGPGGAR